MNITMTCPVAADPRPGRRGSTCTGTYARPPGDVDHGSIHNTATATATDPTGPGDRDDTELTTPLTQRPHLGLAKVADTHDVRRRRQTDRLRLHAHEHGQHDAERPVHRQRRQVSVTCTASRDARPRATLVCTATASITQADLDARLARRTRRPATPLRPTADH